MDSNEGSQILPLNCIHVRWSNTGSCQHWSEWQHAAGSSISARNQTLNVSSSANRSHTPTTPVQKPNSAANYWARENYQIGGDRSRGSVEIRINSAQTCTQNLAKSGEKKEAV